MAAVGTVIYGSDYNAVQAKANGILYNGAGYTGAPGTGYGYGQATASGQVDAGVTITAAQWINLCSDLNTCYKHQNNTDFTGYSTFSAATGTNITYANLSALDTVANTIVTNRLTVSPSQLTTTANIGSAYKNATWGSGVTSVESIATFTFSSANAVHYFFNSGGAITFTGATTTPLSTIVWPTDIPNPNKQDYAWRTLLGNFSYTFNRSVIAGFTPSASYTTLYTLNNASTGVYAAYVSNNITVALLYNSSTTLQFRVRFTDGHGTSGNKDSVSAGAGYIIGSKVSSGAVTGVLGTLAVGAFT